MAAVVAVSRHEIVVFGGTRGTCMAKYGYLLDISKKTTKPILGLATDVEFFCNTSVQKVGKNEFFTVGGTASNKVKLIKLERKSKKYWTTASEIPNNNTWHLLKRSYNGG